MLKIKFFLFTILVISINFSCNKNNKKIEKNACTEKQRKISEIKANIKCLDSSIGNRKAIINEYDSLKRNLDLKKNLNKAKETVLKMSGAKNIPEKKYDEIIDEIIQEIDKKIQENKNEIDDFEKKKR